MEYLTAAGRLNSELSVKTFNRSLVSSDCRQQKSIAVLCEVYHRVLGSSHRAANESHSAEKSCRPEAYCRELVITRTAF